MVAVEMYNEKQLREKFGVIQSMVLLFKRLSEGKKKGSLIQLGLNTKPTANINLLV